MSFVVKKYFNVTEIIYIYTYVCMHIYSGSLNIIGTHKLIASGTIRRYGFGEIGMALLEVCHCGGFEVSYMLKSCPVSQTTSCCLLIKM